VWGRRGKKKKIEINVLNPKKGKTRNQSEQGFEQQERKNKKPK